MANTNDTILEAMEIIAKKVVSDVRFDQTVLCSIVNADNADKGEYTVDNGNTKFTAYGDSGFKVDANVYVLIPNGDYNNTCVIVGKQTNTETEPFNWVSPTDRVLIITENLCGPEVKSALLTANNNITPDLKPEDIGSKLWPEPEEVPLVEINDIIQVDAINFDRLTVKADFKTILNSYNTISGNYGLHIVVSWKEVLKTKPLKPETTAEIEREIPHISNIYLDSKDMWGNPYKFTTYFPQEKVFNVDTAYEITGISVYFYQSNNFLNAEGNLIPILKDNMTGEAQPNLFVTNVDIRLGYSMDNITEDTVYTYSLDSKEYDLETSILGSHEQGSCIPYGFDYMDGNDKHISSRWIHKTAEGNFISIDENDELPTRCFVHWYRRRLDMDIYDNFAGNFWEEMTPVNSNTLDIIFTPDSQKAKEEVKSIIELQDKDAYDKAVEEYSPESKALQEEALTALNTKLTDLQTHLAEMDAKMEAGEYVPEEEYSACKRDIAATKKEIAAVETNLTNWETNKAAAIRGAVTLYTSDILTFTNLDSVFDPGTVDLIRGLRLKCLDSYGGIYKIYDPLNGVLTNSIEANLIRKIQANFTSIITGVEHLDKAEAINWYIPKHNTMITKPVEGVEYITGDREYMIEDDNYYIITRILLGQEIEEGTTELEKAVQQAYRIDKYFNENKNNNIIKCEVIRNGIIYKAENELFFGVSGTNGRDSTLILSIGNDYGEDDVLLEENAPAWTIGSTKKLELKAHLYDFNNKEIIISSLTWKHFCPETNELFTIDGSSLLSNTVSMSNFNSCVLQCTAFGGGKSYTAYLPIPIRSSRDYKYLEGATAVIYNGSGTQPSYYKNPYVLYDKSIALETAAQMRNINTGNAKWLPTIKDNALLPANMYLHNVDYTCAVDIITDGNLAWSQPILIILNRYSSSMLNKWDGHLLLDEENSTLLSALVGAGKKNADNSFSGVLIGDLQKAGASSLTGVYGYQKGELAYSLTEDGKAILGKNSGAQLIFDGSTGDFKNRGYDAGTGMRLHMDGKENSEQFLSLKAGGKEYVRLSTKGPFLRITNGSQTLISVNDTGTKIGGWDINEKSITSNGGRTILNSNGSMQLGDRFSVDSGGNLWANHAYLENATVKGHIEADTGTLNNLQIIGTLTGGTIRGSYIVGGKIEGNEIIGGSISGTTVAAKGFVTCSGLKVGGVEYGMKLHTYLHAIGNKMVSVVTGVSLSGDPLTGYSLNVSTANIRVLTGATEWKSIWYLGKENS